MEALLPYQETGHKWLMKKRWALLADDMGLGKSCQTIAAADGLSAQRILVICPAVARVNWRRQFALWSVFWEERDFKVCYTLTDSPSERCIVSYEYVSANYLLLRQWEWDLVVVDEVQFAKSTGAERAKAVFGKKGVIRNTKRLWALSGTPSPNNNSELWILLYTFGVTDLPYEDFVRRYCISYNANGRRFIKGNNREMDAEVRGLLSKIMLRRKKEEVMKDLPPIFYEDVVVEAGEVDLEIETSFQEYYPAERRAELETILENDRRLVTETVQRLSFTKSGLKVLEGIAASVSTLRRYTGLQKVKGAVELIDGELEAGDYEKIVIFAIHRDVIEGMRQRLSKWKPVTLYGGTSAQHRQRNIDKFVNNPKCRVFIGNIQAAGTAITLTVAHQVLFVEQSWVPGENAQAAMRCHRLGQTETVFVRFLGLADSIDQAIASVLKRKTKDLTAVLDTPLEQEFTPVNKGEDDVED